MAEQVKRRDMQRAQNAEQLRMVCDDAHLKRFKRADRELGLLSRDLCEDTEKYQGVADHVEDLRDRLESTKREYIARQNPR